MFDIYSEFKRKFSVSMYKNLKLKLAEMSFSKDFIHDTRGDLYPVISKSEDCNEYVKDNLYKVENGSVSRLFCQFFPYATYEITIKNPIQKAGFSFSFPQFTASVLFSTSEIMYISNNVTECREYACCNEDETTFIVSCRPGAFDVYVKKNNKHEYIHTFSDDGVINSNRYEVFSNSYVHVSVYGNTVIKSISSYIDNGISLADIRPIRYENSEVMIEQGKVYLTASVRMQEESFQGVLSWVPGTMEFSLTGAMFYDCGDGAWCGDVASSLLYHRQEHKWLLWVCSFSHGHILAHASFDGDPRFGVNVIDVTLMKHSSEGSEFTEFLAFEGDEDPDFFYDADNERWLMSVCRINPVTKQYAYLYFESKNAFEGYKYVGKGPDGCETGGSFVIINGEIYFICGNDFNKTSDYRVYSKSGMKNARFNYPDGGFRGWGTVIPVKMGSRTRYFWLTFDRHNASDYNWSYGNIYCFEAE